MNPLVSNTGEGDCLKQKREGPGLLNKRGRSARNGHCTQEFWRTWRKKKIKKKGREKPRGNGKRQAKSQKNSRSSGGKNFEPKKKERGCRKSSRRKGEGRHAQGPGP